MRRDERRQFRYPFEIAVEVKRGRAHAWLMTRDIGFRGVFIHCDDAIPPLRHLVQLAFVLPDGERIDAHGMVIHVVKQGTEDALGFGVQLLGLDGSRRAVWDTFVHRLVRESKGIRAATN
jgi:hypothetical protein